MAKKEAPQAPASAEAKPPGKMKLIILIAVVVLLAIGLSVGATWFLLSKGDSTTEQQAEASAEPAVPLKQPAIYEELSPVASSNMT
jgi:flagellar FliL protein